MTQGHLRSCVLALTAGLLLSGCGRRLTAEVVPGYTGIPMSVSGTVVRSNGDPATEVAIVVHTPQADHYATTDANGDFRLNTGVPRIDGITVEGWGRQSWEWQPKCDRGLRLKLVIHGAPAPVQ